MNVTAYKVLGLEVIITATLVVADSQQAGQPTIVLSLPPDLAKLDPAELHAAILATLTPPTQKAAPGALANAWIDATQPTPTGIAAPVPDPSLLP